MRLALASCFIAALSASATAGFEDHPRIRVALADLRAAQVARLRAVAAWAPTIEALGDMGYSRTQDSVNGRLDPPQVDAGLPGQWSTSVVMRQPLLRDQTLIDDLAVVDAQIAYRQFIVDDVYQDVSRETFELTIARLYGSHRLTVASKAVADIEAASAKAKASAKRGDIAEIDVLEILDRSARWQSQVVTEANGLDQVSARMTRVWGEPNPGLPGWPISTRVQNPNRYPGKIPDRLPGSKTQVYPDNEILPGSKSQIENPDRYPGKVLGFQGVTQIAATRVDLDDYPGREPGYLGQPGSKSQIVTRVKPQIDNPGDVLGYRALVVCPELQSCIDMAMQHNPSLSGLRNLGEQASAIRDRRSRPRLPDVSLDASLRHSHGQGDRIDTDEALVQLKARVPLSWGMEAEAERQVAIAADLAAREKLSAQILATSGDIEIAFAQREASFSQSAALAKRRSIAKKVLSATQKAYAEKQRDARALLDAIETLAMIEMEALRIHEAGALATLRLDHLTGNLLIKASSNN